MPVAIAVRDDVRESLRVAAVEACPVRVAEASQALLEAVRLLGQTYVERWAGRLPSEIDALLPARQLYREFGIDPTRTRPSSEALLRRVLKGKPFPRVSNAVDLCNLLALEFMLPLGLYDTSKIVGDVEIRRGRPGESFDGIRKGAVNVEGRPVVADTQGAFGNPTSDSLRTAVGAGATGLLLVIFAPADTSAERMRSFADRAREAMALHLGAEVVATRIPIP